jgi:type III secretory pathway component EscS
MAPVPGLLFAALLVSVVAAGLMDPVYGWRARRLPAAQSTFAVQERTRRKWTVGLVLVAVGVGLLVGALNHLDRRLGVGMVGLVPGLASLVFSIGIRDRRLRWAARGYAVVAAMVGVPVALWLEINDLQPQGMAFCIALAVPILPVSLRMQWEERRRAEAERQVVRQGMK